jgi:hypothetical protein
MQHPLQQQIRNMNQPIGMNGRYSRDLSDANLSSHMAPVAGSGGLLVNFFYVRVKTRNRDAEHNGKMETRLCVSKQPRGDRSTVAMNFISEKQAETLFPAEFSMFKDMGEVMTTGTPLHELPGISMSQIGMLAINGLRSVEDLVDLSDDVVAQMGLDATKAKKVAQLWLQRRDAETETIDQADLEARMDVERKNYKDQNDKMAATIKALEMQIEAMNKAGAAAMTAQSAMPSNAVQSESTVQPAAMEVQSGEDLPYDLSEMDDPMQEGPDVATGMDDLSSNEVDPLA